MLYCFVGHQPELSILEIESMTGKRPAVLKGEIVTLDDDSSVLDIADKLGGTSKIARSVTAVDQDQVLSKLQELIMAGSAKNIAINNCTGTPVTPSDIRGIKTAVTEQRPVRFVSFEDRGHELVMLKKQHVVEFNLIPENDKVTIAETVWIYDGFGFAARDRKKPYQDIKRGMLPVKIARIMVNLAIQGQEGKIVFDPFCGTGTVLSEAVMVGSRVIGSDIDHLAVSGAETNLSWLSSRYNIKDEVYDLFVSDATHVSSVVSMVDAIVTEPLMGPLLDVRSQIPDEKVRNIAKGLDKLYRGALKAWLPLLPQKGRVVITLPTFRLGSHEIPTISVDTITSLGYNYFSSVAYSKSGATVIRNITILEKK